MPRHVVGEEFLLLEEWNSVSAGQTKGAEARGTDAVTVCCLRKGLLRKRKTVTDFSLMDCWAYDSLCVPARANSKVEANIGSAAKTKLVRLLNAQVAFSHSLTAPLSQSESLFYMLCKRGINRMPIQATQSLPCPSTPCATPPIKCQ